MELPKFYGDPKEWLKFAAAFNTLPSQHTNVFYTFKLGINSLLRTFFLRVELYVLRVLNVCSMFEFPLNMGY